jgi:hypothetical protein
MLVGFSRVSMNAKTGPVPTSMTEQASCPESCPFKAGKLCYPYFSPLGFMWEALNNDGYNVGGDGHRKSITPITWDEFCNNISRLPKNQLWRHNTAGDLPGVGNAIDTQALQQLIDANNKAKACGFTYTHKPVGLTGQALINARAIYAANKSGFRINISADSLGEADELAELNIAPVVVVVPSDAPKKMRTPQGRHVIVCPAEMPKPKRRTKAEMGKPRPKLVPTIQCSQCQLCAKERRAIVAFRSHGTRMNKVNVMLRVLNNE